MARHPHDGLPYYCANCGADYDAWIACNNHCPLETAADAKSRAELREVLGEALRKQATADVNQSK